jgi:hypothetical protein
MNDHDKTMEQLALEVTELHKRCAALERKQLEMDIQGAREYAENIVETVREPPWC